MSCWKWQILAVLTMACSPRDSGDDAPVGGVAGFFEVEVPAENGFGAAVWLLPDGEVRNAMVVMLDGTYRYEAGVLMVDRDEEEVHIPVSVEGDRLVGLGPPGVTVNRVGEAQRNGDIVGVWEYVHFAGSTAFHRFLASGEQEMRLVIAARTGRYTFDGRTIECTVEEETGTYTLSGDGQSLEVDGATLVRVGDRPWYGFEAPTREEIEAVLHPPLPARDLDVVRRLSLEEGAADWQRYREAVRLQEGGVPVAPQVGLVPLRQDSASGLWEFWHPESGARPELDEAGERWELRPEMGMVFILVPGGTALLGEPGAEVTLAPFFLSKYELTVEQHGRLTSISPGDQETSMSPWQDAWHVSDSTRILQHVGLRLPTGDEWEYAARGGTTTIWWTGDAPASLQGAANLCDRSARQAGLRVDAAEWLDDGYARWAPIGQFAANPFGFHDILGNLVEPVRDLRQEGKVVAAGGFFLSLPDQARCVSREPYGRMPGVRPARSIEAP